MEISVSFAASRPSSVKLVFCQCLLTFGHRYLVVLEVFLFFIMVIVLSSSCSFDVMSSFWIWGSQVVVLMSISRAFWFWFCVFVLCCLDFFV